VTVEVDPVVVITEEADVSTEQGVSVFAVEKYVTQIRYVPAATVPPTVEVDAAVDVDVEELAPTTTVGGAAMTAIVKLC